jgi:hypothetical protein
MAPSGPAATEERRRVNDFTTQVLDAATDPDLAGSDAGRVRERLARAAARRGTPLADLVSNDRA